MAPFPNCPPATRGLKNPRLLPEHWLTATMSTAGIFLMSPSDSFMGLSTLPWIPTENASGSTFSGTSARWYRTKKASFGVMTFALKTENGVSSCGGLLVRPIIGRFCGYLTSGRSPFSNGSAAVAANARKEGDVIPAPSAAMAAPECFMRLRRSIIAFLPCRLVAAHDDPMPP